MEFQLNFDMGYSTFDDSPEIEVSKILTVIAQQVINGIAGGSVVDSNGTVVGKWEIEV